MRPGWFLQVTVETSSVNRKQAEIYANLPRELELLEPQVRDVINHHVARGRVTARIACMPPGASYRPKMHINVPLAKAYAAELAKLSKQLKLAGEVTLDQVIRAPGVFQTDEELADAEDLWPAVEKALQQAIAALASKMQSEREALAPWQKI